MNLFIVNNVPYHFEILESVLEKYNQIIKNSVKCTIYMKILDNEGIKSYLSKKYPEIIFDTPSSYDFFIDCTLNHKDLPNIVNKDANTFFYIEHSLTPITRNMSNVYSICPFSRQWFYADKLPVIEKIRTDVPVYIIQGNFIRLRRNFELLERILKENYEKPFLIKILGRSIDMEFVNKFKDRFILKKNLDFEDYHKEFSDVYCILPLILKKTHPVYYEKKMTSSINYARAYNLKCLIDKDLQDIYKVQNAEVFNNEENIVKAFKKTLIAFYN